MNKDKVIECFRLLSFDDMNSIDWAGLLDSKLEEVYNKLQISYEDTIINLTNITSLNFSQNITQEWKYICLGFYIINTLLELFEKSGEVFLSVQETKDFKRYLKCIIHIGISTKLQPNLPFYSNPKMVEKEDIFWNYNVLKCTTFGLTEYLKQPILRFSIIPEGLKEILVSLYQLSYCPLKKSIATTENYKKLIEEQQFFIKKLDHLKQTIHPSIFVKNTMTILHTNSPVWFKRQVSKTLTDTLRSPNGVEIVAVALFGDHENDSTHIWKILEVFSKLILSCKKFHDFKNNTCKQLIHFLNQPDGKSIAENIFTHCTKVFYKEDLEICKSIFIREIINLFLYFTYKTHKFNNEDITVKIKSSSRMLHAVFAEENAVPVNILKPIINVIFRFYILTLETSFKVINNDLKDVLLLYLENQHIDYINIYDRLLFDIDSKEILPFRNNIIVEIDSDSIKLKHSDHSVMYSSSENCECMMVLIKSKSKLLLKLFGFLLNCITNETKYFQRGNEDLLQIEDDLTTEYFERKLAVYKLLSNIAEDKNVQKQLNEKPGDIVEYIDTVLNKTIELGTHLLEDADSEGFNSLFTVLIILENLLTNTSKSNLLGKFKILQETLERIHSETKNKEMKCLIKTVLDLFRGTNTNKVVKDSKSEVDKAIDDICDAFLPTRGHGLLTLTKLIEKKDRDTMERKQFVLNILQQNLTNEDSFIYLNSINGLAAMADIFPDIIIKILCEEYSDSSRKENEDQSEIRMKIGEVLVKVSKVLGEMAPKHKPLLLNTFLIGTKDDDDLIRASSLSNLGEICRVLGYKLGTMFTEVLTCVHSVIAADKSPQARRAAVTVIRQLFIGLDQEIISYFKDDILPIYRSLKHIYNNDTDDVMKLQAQLALEELNESMKNFVFPKPELNFEKKIVMLD